MSRTLVMVLSLVIFNAPTALSEQAKAQDPTTEMIEGIIKKKEAARAFVCQGERVCGILSIPSFYRQRHYAPIWIREGKVQDHTLGFIESLKAADKEGLSPEIYHLFKIMLKHMPMGKGALLTV